jgi:hypothetical protein
MKLVGRTFRRAAAALLVATGVSLGTFAAGQSAAEYILSFYPPDKPNAPQARYTPRTAELWNQCFKRAEANGDACMDFDMFVQGNDFDLSDVTAEQISGDAKQAVVRAQFKNFGKDETVIFNLIYDEGWMIDEITSGCNKLTELLQDKSTCMN